MSAREYITNKLYKRHQYIFILSNVLDLSLTLTVLHIGFVDGNPIVNYFSEAFGPTGVIALKASSILFVLTILHHVRIRQIRKALHVLRFSNSILILASVGNVYVLQVI